MQVTRAVAAVGLWAVLFSGTAHSPMYLDKAKGGAQAVRADGSIVTTYLNVPLDSNGFVAADPSSSWPVPGVAAPSVAWWADDPTGSGGKTTHTFTANGTPTEIDSPFCTDGSWGDISTGECMKAIRFDGASDYYATASPGPASPDSGDFTACMLSRIHTTQSQAASYSVGQIESAGGGEGWSFYLVPVSGLYTAVVRNDAAGVSLVDYVAMTVNAHNWEMLCYRSDHDGNITPYADAVADTPTAGPGGTLDPSAALSVGSAQIDIASVFFWDSLLDATDILELWHYFTGILDMKGHTALFKNTGPNCCWVDGAVECFNDDFPLLGCELPPGFTGAGTPSDGFYSGPAITNLVPRSRTLNNWAQVGTPTRTLTSTDLFRSLIQTYRVCDDDGAAVEGVQSANVDVTDLDTSDEIQVCVYAKDSSGTVLDLQVDESGVCGGSTIDFAAKTITTSWSSYQWTHTLADGTCTTANYKLSPTDWGTVGSTMCAEFVVQVFEDQRNSFCPPTYIETGASAVGGGNDSAEYDITGSAMLDGGGSLPQGTIIYSTFAQDTGLLTGSIGPWSIKDSDVDGNYLWSATGGNGDHKVAVKENAGAAEFIYDRTGADHVMTEGVFYDFVWTIYTESNETTLTIDGADQPGTTAAYSTTPPDDLDELEIDGFNATSQDGIFIKDMRVRR